ncbi:MAG: hypothetical protein JWP34_5114 [Massilia sp.]|nr:hypothetical protein [Massilia sp.]
MTGPEQRGLAENWKFTRGVADRVEQLEKWRAASEAVSAWRRWALPLALSVLAVGVTVINLLTGHH